MIRSILKSSAKLLADLKGVDGPGSGLDADLVDGVEVSALQSREEKDQPDGYPGLDASGNLVTTIIHRQGTAAELAAVVLAAGEWGYATDTGKIAMGDGATAFASLDSVIPNYDYIHVQPTSELGSVDFSVIRFGRDDDVNFDSFPMELAWNSTAGALRFQDTLGDLIYPIHAYSFIGTYSQVQWINSVNLSMSTTPTDGHLLYCAGATAGVPVRLSPRTRWRGYAWRTDTSAAQSHDFTAEVVPTSGSGSTTAKLRFGYSFLAGAYNYFLSFLSNGGVEATSYVAATSFGNSAVQPSNGVTLGHSGSAGYGAYSNINATFIIGGALAAATQDTPVIQFGGDRTLTRTQSAGATNPFVRILPTYNQSGTAGSVDLLVNRTETAVGSGSHYFLDCQIAGTSKARISNAGLLESTDMQLVNQTFAVANGLGARLGSARGIYWSSASSAFGALDISLTRAAAGVLQLNNALRMPDSSTPATVAGAGTLYVEGGALKYKGSAGTVTTIGAA